MSYKKTNDGSATVFTVEPEVVPSATKPLVKLLLIAGVPVWLAIMFLNFYAGLVAIAVIWSLGKFVGKMIGASSASTDYRARSTFRVTPDSIVKDGVTFPVKDVHRLIIRNHVSAALGRTETIVVSTGTYGAAGYNAGRGMGMARNRMLEQISNRIDVESGGRATTLAGGMDEVAVFGLAKDIQAITRVELYQ